MNLLQTLVQLQAVDQEWDDKGRAFRSIRQQLSDQSELEAQREAQRASGSLIAAKRAALRDLELQLGSLRDKLKQVDEDLYGGRIRAARELEGLTHEREQVAKRQSEVEEEALNLMAELEDLEPALTQSAAALSAFEQRWAAEREMLTQQYRALHGRLQELQSARQSLRDQVGGPELALYEELRKAKGGVVLSAVQDGTCQTCHVAMPVGRAAQLRSGEAMVICEGCGRILYII